MNAFIDWSGESRWQWERWHWYENGNLSDMSFELCLLFITPMTNAMDSLVLYQFAVVVDN